MAKQGTWTSCCDVLSSMISSHGNVFIDHTDFFIGSHSWPSVQESIRRCHVINGEDSSSDDWSIFELSGFDDLLPSKILNTEKDCRVDDELSACLESWEIVESSSRNDRSTISSSDSNDTNEINQISGAFRTVKFNNDTYTQVSDCTYRDVLMTRNVAKGKNFVMKYDEVRSISQPYKWKPRFEVTKTGRKRVDRCYGQNEVLATANYNDDEGERLRQMSLNIELMSKS